MANRLVKPSRLKEKENYTSTAFGKVALHEFHGRQFRLGIRLS